MGTDPVIIGGRQAGTHRRVERILDTGTGSACALSAATPALAAPLRALDGACTRAVEERP
jgi:hypothetical protein